MSCWSIDIAYPYRIWIFVFGTLLATTQKNLGATDSDNQAIEFFETKIRPVLVQECYGCHSVAASNAGKLRGGLFLDSRASSQKGGESGPAVVPGKPNESLLINAIRHESFEMPPKGKLPDSVIRDFEKWIESGATDPRVGNPIPTSKVIDIDAGKQFWSFQPLQVKDPPPASAWTRTKIDRFVQQKQNEAGLLPNAIAEPRVLVRRAWFDLLGLPPSSEEMEYWVARLTFEESPTLPLNSETSAPTTVVEPRFESAIRRFNYRAWSELIDHLLRTPHYGERWARHWIDVARFAESHGYEQDYNRPNAYYYRDFLIRAFNDDLPYDDFIKWQLAGDELEPNNPLAWFATGFLGAGAFPTQLTENEFESARYDELDDMVATTGVAFLGLSVGCARCHDHKFDPIPTADYYRMASTFTKVIRSEKEFDLEPAENRQRILDYEQKRNSLQNQLAALEQEDAVNAFFEFLSSDQQLNASPWHVIKGKLNSTASTEFKELDDGSYLAVGKVANKEDLTFSTTVPASQIHGIRLEALADPSLPQQGPGRNSNGNFVLSEIEIVVNPSSSNDASSKPFVLEIGTAEATYQQNKESLSVASSIDKNLETGWAIDGAIGKDSAAVFRLKTPADFDSESPLVIKMAFHHANNKHTIGRFRLSVSNSPNASVEIADAAPSHEAVKAITSLRTTMPRERGEKWNAWREEQHVNWNTAFDWFKTTFAPWKRAMNALRKLKTNGPSVQLHKVMVASEGLPPLPHHADSRGFPHFYPVTYQLRRGDVTQKGEPAQPGFLQVLLNQNVKSDLWKEEKHVEPSQTTHYRARLAKWMVDPKHGAGALAARVMVNRLWQHHFGRGLVSTTNDFGMAGDRPSHPELLDWLATELIENGWRLKTMHKLMMTSSVYLLSAEMGPTHNSGKDSRAELDPDIRLLWRRTPQRLEAEAIRDSMLAVSGQLDTSMFGPGTLDVNMRRRSLYFLIKRSDLIPMMMLFDWPEHLVSIGQRASTTIAPQALHFMNGPQGRAYAEAFAKRVRRDDPTTAIQLAYQCAYGRAPLEKEHRLAQNFLTKQMEIRSDRDGEVRYMAALADFCQVLMSSNEFVFLE